MRLLTAVAAAVAALAMDNGLARTPPMGWRSWNLFGSNVNQGLMESQMAGVASRNMTVNGVPMSLADLGYSNVGLDDNWQACGSYGPNKDTYHDENGRPVVNQGRFPDMIAMTSYAHSLNLSAGWYGNNCICSDHCSDPSCYVGDVNAANTFGFDAIKLDGCGAERDLDMWANLFNASGHAVLIENCHWGDTLPNKTWCPWHYYRSSGDIRSNYGSIVNNLQTTIPLAQQGLSTPGCWAYPDMLEVGVGLNSGGLSLTESRSHFGAWCIVSSPLILSHDTTDQTVTQAIWPIIANTEAIAVNQAYYSGNAALVASGTVFYSCSTTVTLDGDVPAVSSCQYFYKPLSATQTAVLMMNHGAATQSLTLTFNTIPGVTCTTCPVRDIWNHANIGPLTNTYTVNLASHDSAFLVIG